MECHNIGNVSFGTRLTLGPKYRQVNNLKKYLENGIIEFEKQTKDKQGCMALRALDTEDKSPDAVFFFWNSKTPPRTCHYYGYINKKYTQIALTTRDFLKHLIVEKSPKEQADIFESIFDALQVIPKKIKRNERQNAQFMSNLSEQISEKLGKNKELLSPMFEHITYNPVKKLSIEDIDF